MRFKLKPKNKLKKKILSKRSKNFQNFLKLNLCPNTGWKKELTDVDDLWFYKLNKFKPIDEVVDIEMTALPDNKKINYAKEIFGFQDEGTLPDDLSISEQILTNLLWGKINKDRAVLLVAAIEDMNIEDVENGIRKLGL